MKEDPRDDIIEKLELVIDRQRRQIFELTEENQMLKIQLKAMGVSTNK